MNTKSDMALERFVTGDGSAQAVLCAYGPELGLPGETALKLATGLGSGIARRGQVCGALTGGILVLGLKYGRGGERDRSATEQTYQKAQDLLARFERRHGSCLCRVLLQGCNLQTAEGKQHYEERGLLRKQCAGYVQTVMEELPELLKAPAVP
jgi:C_GCAxxG_C_C family probable redox protein